MTRSWPKILFALLMISMSGCASLWHDLKPHRMRRFNRVSAPALNPEFTHLERNQLRLGAEQPAVLTANSAEVILARGQN